MLKYVLITSARNEADNIDKTLKSCISQTIKPDKWVIVSDSSTDDTDKIIREYSDKYKWIDLIRLKNNTDRSFARKVECFNEGFNRLRDINYDLIGNIDADISFESDFFEFLIEKFEKNSSLGLAGTHFMEENYHSDKDSFTDALHVAGACQFFRRKCFEDIGGYEPLKEGGIDWLACRKAHLHGWKTCSFKGKTFFHHRRLGTADRNVIGMRFNYGIRDYNFGNHPLYEIFRIFYQMTRKPYILGGLFLCLGYLWANIRRKRRTIPINIIAFNRNEQLKKLKNIITKLIYRE